MQFLYHNTMYVNVQIFVPEQMISGPHTSEWILNNSQKMSVTSKDQRSHTESKRLVKGTCSQECFIVLCRQMHTPHDSPLQPSLKIKIKTAHKIQRENYISNCTQKEPFIVNAQFLNNSKSVISQAKMNTMANIVIIRLHQ